MKYLFDKKEINSLKDRSSYVYDVFHLYAINKEETENFIILETFPFGYMEVFFILGHDVFVYEYLNKNINKINENVIVAITCLPNKLKKFLSYNKKIYVSKNYNELTRKYNGNKWGFNFDITDSEIDLYNNRSINIIEKIQQSMVNLKDIK